MSKDGGPAFPLNTPKWHEQVSDQGSSGDVDFTMGMTLRDYFAAKAMQGELAAMQDPEGEICGVALDAPDDTLARLAKHYYRLADAMLAARAKP